MTKLQADCEVITVFFTVGSERNIRCSSGLSSRASNSLFKSSKQHHLPHYCTDETLFLIVFITSPHRLFVVT